MNQKQAGELINTYPFNLSFDIFENWEQAQNIQVSEIIKQLGTLTEREQEIIQLRYSEKLTYKEIGVRLSISPGRASEICRKGLRRMRHPSRAVRYIAVSMREHLELQKSYRQAQNEIQVLNDALKEALDNDVSLEDARDMAEYRELMERSVETLQLRSKIISYLRMHGINRLRDFKDMSFADVTKINNIGTVAAQEVLNALEKVGIKLSTKK